MGNTKNTGTFIRKIFIGILLIIAIVGSIYILIPDESRKELNKTLGIGQGVNNDPASDEELIVIRNMTSRKAIIGDKWVISGKLYNLSDSLTVNYIKLMFNFSDGVETIEYDYKIRPQNSFGKKFKEKIEGHGDADFEDVEVMDVGTE